jgi:hypothetical protein
MADLYSEVAYEIANKAYNQIVADVKAYKELPEESHWLIMAKAVNIIMATFYNPTVVATNAAIAKKEAEIKAGKTVVGVGV